MKNNYIVIGDSIVYGIGGYEQNGWVSKLKNNLLNSEGSKESTKYVHCVGFPGATSKSIFEKIEYIINAYYSNDMKNIFIISIGVNDSQIFKEKNKVDISDYKENIYKIINAISKKENASIILLGLTRIQQRNEPFYWKPEKYYDDKTIANYDRILQETCKNTDIKYISMRDVLEENDYIDGLHPNDNGYTKIFKKVLVEIDKNNLL